MAEGEATRTTTRGRHEEEAEWRPPSVSPAGRLGPPPSLPLASRVVLLWAALLGFLPLLGCAPIPSIQHTYESVKHMQISVQPAGVVQISTVGTDNQNPPKSAELSSAEEEEKTLNDLVGLLQDMVKNIPTEQTRPAVEPHTAIVSPAKPSPSETADTVWKSIKPKEDSIQVEASQTVVLAKESAPSTTAFWKLRNDASASVVLHSDVTTTENTIPESHQRELSASVAFYSATPAPEKPLVSVSLFMENNTAAAAKSKSFDQLTNGALSNLVESLKNVKKLHLKLHESTTKPQQESHKEKPEEAPQHKPSGTDILTLIDVLIKTIKNAPSAVKKDPALHTYIDKAEGFLKDALEMAAEAENKLSAAMKQGQQEKTEEATIAPSATVPVSVVAIHVTPSPSDSVVKKAEETQVEMGKLKGFINLLYGFSPELTSYAQNSPNKKVAEDIVDRAMAVLDAIKSVFCGNPEGRSKQMLKQLLEKDMELVKQAMKEERVS